MRRLLGTLALIAAVAGPCSDNWIDYWPEEDKARVFDRPQSCVDHDGDGQAEECY